MKLKKIYFDAFKSLIDKEIELEHNCVGFVGTNESGKSNVLLAINCLSGNRRLSSKDKPKMSNNKQPTLRYIFELNTFDIENINNVIDNWCKSNTLVETLSIKNLDVSYKLFFNNEKETEEREIQIDNIIGISDKYLLLKKEHLNSQYKIYTKDGFIPLNQSIVISHNDLKEAKKYFGKLDILNKLKTEINELEKAVHEIKNKENDNKEENTNKEESNLKSSREEIKLNKLNEQKTKLELDIKDFDFNKIIENYEKEILKDVESKTTVENKISQLTSTIEKLTVEVKTDSNKKGALTLAKKNIEKEQNKLILLEKAILDKRQELESFNTPIEQKYTTNFQNFNEYISKELLPKIDSLLPKVVFWKHSNEYIIQSETQFDDLLKENDLNRISRPLVNIFRIGFNIKTIEDLKSWIKKIRTDPNERSRNEKKLNNSVNRYIKSVWEDYDQDIKISLEQDQIRIEIFDPSVDDSSFYNMEERSQGAQTFLSFLLTIGAEAKQGVIKDNILLLDEPETHLHPSGVRFMLKELLKISKNNNTVLYATHSIFMIDRDNYDRHIILEKKKEQTIIKPSKINRIGFFMQEEVLYKTLDIDLSKDFSSSKRFNFVFEGYGDALLFEHYYNSLDNKPFPVKNTSFNQGGKCSDIKKYFSHNPIQLGTKWVFIIDKDIPADDLKKFIEGKYKDYINKDIYIFQFVTETDSDNPEFELEDLLPKSIIKNTYKKTFDDLKVEFDLKELDKILEVDKLYSTYSKNLINELDFDSSEINRFKGYFKMNLNNEILNEIKNCKDKKEFNEKFSAFNNWANDVMKKLKE